VLHIPSVITIVADGARPDTLTSAIDAGQLPALRRIREEGSLHTLSTVFPSVTGPAYAPFLTGRHPGSVGLPGLRWYDRARSACSWPAYARSYVGAEMRRMDSDLDAASRTMFELAGSSIGALNVIGRGLPVRQRLGRGTSFVARTAVTHFRGNVAGWLDIDRDIGDEMVRRIRAERPQYVFAAFTGIDKASHARGHAAPLVLDAMRIVNDMVARIRDDAERAGRWDATHIWVVSDHGHSPVLQHEDTAGFVKTLGYRVLAHPFVFTRRPEVAVMVSGNAMAHLYVDLEQRERRFWDALAPSWESLADALLARDSVDVMLLPLSRTSCEIRSRTRGRALLTWTDTDYSYHPQTGDPLGVGELESLSANESHAVTMESDYPDALVQIAKLAACARSGDIILSAARDWDLRARFEPIPHVSSHGALHREHMLVPLNTNRQVMGKPRRTVDIMPSACRILHVDPGCVEGNAFVID
jgi:hypothetical protein